MDYCVALINFKVEDEDNSMLLYVNSNAQKSDKIPESVRMGDEGGCSIKHLIGTRPDVDTVSQTLKKIPLGGGQAQAN